MKKIVSTICVIALFGMLSIPFVACTEVEENASTEIKELRFDIQVQNASDAGTKAVKTAWENGDKVYLFFNLEGAKYVTLTYNGSTWEGAMSGDLSDASELGTAGTMYGIYFPFGGVAIAADGEGGVTFKGVSSNDKLNGEPIYTYYMTGAAPYTVTTAGDVSTLSGRISLTIPDGYVYFFMNANGENYKSDGQYRLSAEGLKPFACTGFNKDDKFTVTELTAQNPVWGYAYKEDAGIAFSGKLEGSWDAGSSHLFRLYNENDPTLLTKTITVPTGQSLTSHASVRLTSPAESGSGWTKRGFRGYEVSKGVLKRNTSGQYSLTDEDLLNSKKDNKYTSDDLNYDTYYFKFSFLAKEEELGSTTESSGGFEYTILKDTKLPNGWRIPNGFPEPGNTDWGKIILGAPKEPIIVETKENEVVVRNTITEQGKALALVTVDGTYYGLILFRDGSFIPKEGGIVSWGGSKSETYVSNLTENPITSSQLKVLQEAGCLFVSCSGYKSSSWSNAKYGYFFHNTMKPATSSQTGQKSGYYLNIDYGSKKVTIKTGSTSEYFVLVRLVKTL